MIVSINDGLDIYSGLIEPDKYAGIKGSEYIEQNNYKLKNIIASKLYSMTGEYDENIVDDILSTLYIAVKEREKHEGWKSTDDDGTEAIIKAWINKLCYNRKFNKNYYDKIPVYHIYECTNDEDDKPKFEIPDKVNMEDLIIESDITLFSQKLLELSEDKNISESHKRLIISTLFDVDLAIKNNSLIYFLKTLSKYELNKLKELLEIKKYILSIDELKEGFEKWIIKF